MKSKKNITNQVQIIKASQKSMLDQIRDTKHFEKSDYGYVNAYHFPNRYVGDIILQNFINDWSCRSPVGIFSQTGSGKSTLIFNKILKTVKERRKRLCILASRTALVYQYKKQAAELEEPNLLEELTEKGIKNRCNYGDIDIYSYQELMYLLLQNPSFFFDEYEVVVLDECHFFVQDSPFNKFTQELLETIITAAQNCIRVYLTATPDACLEDVIELEQQHSQYYPNDMMTDGYHMTNPNYYPHHFLIYYFDNNYDYIKPCFFTADTEIIDVIKADQSNDKYLICVDSKPLGQALAESLGKTVAEFIDAELKNTIKSKEVNSMIINEKFEKKVLIATSFLDVGINLKDDDLKNVVIYSTNKTHFLQSIGRKRKQNHQKVNLYIHIPSPDDINHSLKKARFQKNDLVKNIELICNSKAMYLTDLPDFIYAKKVKSKEEIRYNSFTFSYLKYRIRELEDMTEALADNPNSNEVFAKHFLSWLGLEPFYENYHWLGKTPDTINNELVDLIERYAYCEMSKDQFNEFKQEFQSMYNSLYPQTAIRNGRPPHTKKTNDIFNELKLPYVVSNIGNATYTIKKG